MFIRVSLNEIASLNFSQGIFGHSGTFYIELYVILDESSNELAISFTGKYDIELQLSIKSSIVSGQVSKLKLFEPQLIESKIPFDTDLLHSVFDLIPRIITPQINQLIDGYHIKDVVIQDIRVKDIFSEFRDGYVAAEISPDFKEFISNIIQDRAISASNTKLSKQIEFLN